MAIETVKYPPHEIALLIPRPTAAEQDELTEDIRKNSLQEAIVLYEGKVLDGVSRQIACVRAKKEPRYAEFMRLNPEIREAGPLAFVIGRNLKRRMLTTSQKSVIAAETIPAFEAAAKERRQAALKKTGELTEDGAEPETAGKSAAKAAKAFGVSTRSVESARKLIKKNPKKAAAVKAGKTTVGAASVDKKKVAKKAKAEKKAGAEFSLASTFRDLKAKIPADRTSVSVVIGEYRFTAAKIVKK